MKKKNNLLSSKEIETYLNLNFIKRIFFILSLLYFVFYFFANINDISFKLDSSFEILFLFLSYVLCVISIYLNAFGWKQIIIWFGNNNIADSINFYILTNSLKYVPGGIWHFIERFNFLKSKTNDKFAVYVCIIEPYFMLATSLFMVSFGLYYSPIYVVFLLPILLLNRYLIYYLLLKLRSFKIKFLKKFSFADTKDKFFSEIKIKSFFPQKILFLESFFIIFKFLSFLICFDTFNQQIDQSLLFIFINFCLSWSIGLIIPAAPGGLGVFESCFLLLMGRNFLQPSIIESLICFRFISTFADLSLSSPFLLKKYFLRR